MERRRPRRELLDLDHARFEPSLRVLIVAFARVLPVEQRRQRVGLGDVEVVPRDDTDLRAPAQRELGCVADAAKARSLHERRDDRDVVGTLEQRQHVPCERVVLSAGRQRGNVTEVVSAAWDHMPNAAPRVVHVPLEPRDDVHVQVHHGLAGCLACVEADVVAVGVKLLIQLLLHHLDQREDRRALVRRGREPVHSHPTGDDKRVPA